MAKIYLDFNVYINMAKNPEFKQVIINLKKDHSIFYAFPIAEELYKNKNTVHTAGIPNIIKIVKETTDNNIVGPTIDDSFEFGKMNFSFEYNRCGDFLTQDYVDFCGLANHNLFNIEKISEEDQKMIRGLSSKSLWKNKTVNSIVKKFGFNINPKSVDCLNFAVPYLSQILASVGYAVEKNEHTYISGVYDDTHLIYASQCDYFVTSDLNCFKKAEAIFEKIGVKTKAVKLSNPEKVSADVSEWELRYIKKDKSNEMGE